MEYQGEVYISCKYKKEDYLKIKLNLKSNNEEWEKAVEIFDDRINGRYILPLLTLRKDIKINGFIIMAIECLLIETLLQFREGIEKIKDKQADIYSDFLKNEFPKCFDKNSGEIFYKGIRCGILHSAQTKNNTILTTDNTYITKYRDGILYVSVERLFRELRKYYKNYKRDLLNPKQKELRKNFIKKMELICKK